MNVFFYLYHENRLINFNEMKKPISHELVKWKLFITLLFVFIASTNLCWAQDIPMEIGGCFSSNGSFKPCGSSWTDYYNGVAYNCFCDCPKIGSNCVPINNGSNNVNPGPVSFPGQANPGDVSINGILEGKSIFTSHQSSAFEDWAQEYKQLLASYGINSILGANFKFPRTPLTDDKAFNIVYITLSSNFRPMIKPVLTPSIAPAPTPKIAPAPAPKAAPAVNPNTEFPAITVPIMGGSPLTQAERERQNAYNLKSIPDNRLAESNFKREESPFWNTPEMKDLGTKALQFSAGFVTGPLAIPAVIGAEVISGVVNNKGGQEIIFDVIGSVTMKQVGDFIGTGIGKGNIKIGKLNIGTGILAGQGAKEDYEILLQSGQSLIDAWDVSKSPQKK